MYKEKYLKYKTKYLDLKNQLGGENVFTIMRKKTIGLTEGEKTDAENARQANVRRLT